MTSKKAASNPRGRPIALNLGPSSIAPETNGVAAFVSEGSSDAKSFEVPRTLLLPVGSASLGPPSALELDRTVEDSGEVFLKGEEDRRRENEEKTEAVVLGESFFFLAWLSRRGRVSLNSLLIEILHPLLLQQRAWTSTVRPLPPP